MSALSRFIGGVAAPALRRRGYARRGMVFRRPFGTADWTVVDFQASRGHVAPVAFYVNLGVAVSCYSEFIVRGNPAADLPSAAMGLWFRRLDPEGSAGVIGPWVFDSADDEPATSDFIAALEAQLDELDQIADREVLLHLARERARMVDKSKSGIVLPTEAAEALLLWDPGDRDGAERAAKSLAATDPDNDVSEWVLNRI